MRIKSSVCGVLPVLVVVSTFMGCDTSISPDDAVAAANSTNIQRVANLYLAYQANNNWVGPDDESKFKEFIRSLSEPQLKRVGVNLTDLDKLFVSERDGQPFKIRYKVVGNVRGSTEPVVFESEGVGGQRMVGFLNMSQREVGVDEYDQLFAGKTVTPVRSN